jgi:hypothetical protein
VDALAVIAGVGVGASLASISLFIASGRNKRKALNPSLCVKIEHAASIQHASPFIFSYPAISFKINL